MATWLILDSNYLCHRAFYTMGHLTHGDILTGVVFGFLRDIPLFQERHGTKNIVFCFDHGRGARQELFPDYKGSRKATFEAMDEDEQATHREFRKQTSRLRDVYLKKLGFRNVFSQPGYEADDIIASVVDDLPAGDEAIILSSDEDLFQLLSARVRMHNPVTHRTTTIDSFREKWGIDPMMWSHVKAFAGCSTDDVPGIPGVGEVTAAKWVRGELKPGTKTYDKVSNGLDVFNRNIKLVSLPFPGTEHFKLREDRVTEEKWAALADSLGMKSIRDKAPAGVRKGTKRGRKGKGFGLNSSE